MKNYMLKLDNTIISKRKTARTYNCVWVRVLHAERRTSVGMDKNTGETIGVKNCSNQHYPKKLL